MGQLGILYRAKAITPEWAKGQLLAITTLKMVPYPSGDHDNLGEPLVAKAA